MDAYDRAAKEWHSCRACAEIDQDCPRYVPKGNWDYYYEFHLISNPWGIFNAELSNLMEFSCTPSPFSPDEPYEGCNLMMCECDLRLAKELSKLYATGDV